MISISDETHADLDVGAMARSACANRVTVHVTEPEFGEGADALELKRQARAGVALSSGPRGVIGTATVAVDADLTTDGRRCSATSGGWQSAAKSGLRQRGARPARRREPNTSAAQERR